MPFKNYSITKGGALTIGSIHSPNFNVANPTASPTPSWAWLKNGLIYAFGVVLSGGTITGPDYIINTSGIFIYSGTPANGNLIGSWAGSAGTDGFGNAYPQGFNITKGAISGTTFTGPDYIINTAGAFFYSSTPAAGNLIGSIASVSGTDSFGNSYQAGFTSYTSGGYIRIGEDSVLQQCFLIMLPPNSTHVSDFPQLIGSALNGGAANEQEQVKLTSGGTSTAHSSAIVLTSDAADGSLVGTLRFFAGTNITLAIAGASLVLANGAQSSTISVASDDGHPAFSKSIELGGTSAPSTPGGGVKLWAVSSNTSLQAKSVSGQTGQVPLTQSDTGSTTLGNSTTAIAITRTWNVAANDAVVSGTLGTIYELETTLNGTIESASALQVGFMLDGTFTNMATITPGFTAGHNFVGAIRIKFMVTATGVSGTWNIAMDGTIQDGTATRSPSTSMTDNGFRTGVSIDTTASHMIAIGAKWNALVTGQTVDGIGSKFTRYGL